MHLWMYFRYISSRLRYYRAAPPEGNCMITIDKKKEKYTAKTSPRVFSFVGGYCEAGTGVIPMLGAVYLNACVCGWHQHWEQLSRRTFERSFLLKNFSKHLLGSLNKFPGSVSSSGNSEKENISVCWEGKLTCLKRLLVEFVEVNQRMDNTLETLTRMFPTLNQISTNLPKVLELLSTDTASEKRSWSDFDFWIAHVKPGSSDLNGCEQLWWWIRGRSSDWLTRRLILFEPLLPL